MAALARLRLFLINKDGKMNSLMTCQLPVMKQTKRKTTSNEEFPRIRPLPGLLRVLIVDGQSRAVANAEMIGGFGHAVEMAQDGITALRMAANNRPDAVLLSVDLRSREACDVARHLRLDFPERSPLIIGFASYANSLMRWRCLQAGMHLVLEAPLNAEAIETVLLFECARVTVHGGSDSTMRPRQVRIPAESRLLPQEVASVQVN